MKEIYWIAKNTPIKNIGTTITQGDDDEISMITEVRYFIQLFFIHCTQLDSEKYLFGC